MTEKKNNRNASPASVDAINRQGVYAKEYYYVFRLSAEDNRIFNRYRDRIARAATGFAEIYYEYLFGNPDIANILYSCERKGGDIGQWVRAQLACLFDVFVPEKDSGHENTLAGAGAQHFEQGFKPVWIIATYHLFIDHLKGLLPGLNLAPDDSRKLESVLNRLLLRNLGLVMEGYWQAAGESVGSELARLEKDRGRAEELLDSLPGLFWSVDVRKNNVVFANRSSQGLYGEGLEAPLPCLSDTCEEDRQKLLTGWTNAVDGSTGHVDVRMSLAGGELHWYRVAFYPVCNRLGRTAKIHCVVEDIHQLTAERSESERLATTDKLTQLPNRALWMSHLSMALAVSRRVPGSQLVVIVLDINQFRMYSDTLGDDVGDILLHDVARRLHALVRESDLLARLGADCFGIMLQPASHARAAADRVITRILDAMNIPFLVRDKQLCVGVTLGISCFPENGMNEESLLENAENALKRARRDGLPYQYFAPLTDVSPVEQLRFSGQLPAALENDEFELYYQPQLDMQTSRINAAEALLRWIHPLEGVLMPQRIIPLAEQLGLITQLTDWVLLTALLQCRQWSFEGTPVPVSVNLSAQTFHDPRLLDRIRKAINEAGVDGDCLEIEITEATLMRDIDHAAEVLMQLSDCGVSVAIDDFGTGYSSLSRLEASADTRTED